MERGSSDSLASPMFISRDRAGAPSAAVGSLARSRARSSVAVSGIARSRRKPPVPVAVSRDRAEAERRPSAISRDRAEVERHPSVILRDHSESRRPPSGARAITRRLVGARQKDRAIVRQLNRPRCDHCAPARGSAGGRRQSRVIACRPIGGRRRLRADAGGPIGGRRRLRALARDRDGGCRGPCAPARELDGGCCRRAQARVLGRVDVLDDRRAEGGRRPRIAVARWPTTAAPPEA